MDEDALTDFDRQQVRFVNQTIAMLFLPTTVPEFTEANMVAVKRLVRAEIAKKEVRHAV